MSESQYATYAGKTYLKSVMLVQANKALEEGQEFIVPEGVVFECKQALRGNGEDSMLDHLYVVVAHIPFPGRFLVRRHDGQGETVHALASSVKRVVSIPDECPPVLYWTSADDEPAAPPPRPWK